MSSSTSTISASWSFDSRPQGGSGYAYVPKFQDYSSWRVNAASYGSQGSAEISLDLQSAPYSDILTQSRRAKIVSTLRLNTNAQDQVSDYIFTGYLDTLECNLRTDDLTVKCRDASQALMESTVNSRSYQNKPVNQLIAELTLAVNINPDVIANVTNNVGYYFNAKSGMAEHRSSAWDLIQRLATETENVFFCTPQGLCYFGPRERPGVNPIVLNWSYTDDTNDFLELTVDAEPLRNSIFFVIVQGHQPHNGSNVVGTAAYVNDSIASDLGISAGIFEGWSLAKANSVFGEDSLQVYNFNVDGLTAAGVQNKATAQCLDIQGHEFVVKATVLGSARFRVADPLVIQGTGQPALDGRRFTITSVEHELTLSREFDTNAHGFLTHLTLWASGAQVTTAAMVVKKKPAPTPVQPTAPIQPQPNSPPYDPYSICKEVNSDTNPSESVSLVYNPYAVNYVERD